MPDAPLVNSPWLAHYEEGVPQNVPLFDRPLFDLLDSAAQRFPQRTALIFQNTRLTYAALQEQAEKFAASLRLMGVNEGDRVAIMLPNLPQTIIAFWGVLKAGAVVVMTNPLYMETEILHHMKDSGAKHIIMLDMLWPKIAPLRSRMQMDKYIITSIADALTFPLNWLYTFKKKREAAHSTSSGAENSIPNDDSQIVQWKKLFAVPRFSMDCKHAGAALALIQYTGGTTGLPKGVMLTHQNLGTNARQIIAALKKTPEEKHTFVALLPYFHVYGLTTGLIIPAILAANTLPTPMYVPQDILKLIKKFRPTIFPGAPAVYISLMQQKNFSSYDLRCIELCVSGSAPLSREHFKKFQEITGATIVEGYGLTEASPITHINPVQSSMQKLNSIGMPLPGTEARIVDMEGGSLNVGPGKMGELIVRGPQIMQGYLHHPDESASALRNGWLYTGDLATMDEDGYFYIVDRKKDMVIVSGYNVYPREVDEVLLEHPKVLEAVTVGIHDPSRGESLKVFVVVHEGESITRAEIIAWCRSKLAAYKVPRQVEFRTSLPKTAVGKVLRRILRAEEDAATPAATPEGKAPVAPHNASPVTPTGDES